MFLDHKRTVAWVAWIYVDDSIADYVSWAAWFVYLFTTLDTPLFLSAMEDTNVKLTLDLGHKALAQMARMSNHHIALVWDLGPNVTLGIKYLAGSILIWKSLEVSWLDCSTSTSVKDSSLVFITVIDQYHCCMDIQTSFACTITTIIIS